MGDYHILSADVNGNRFSVVFHFPVADVANAVGVNYRTAVVEYQGGAPISSALPNPGSEQAQLDAGELYERSYSFNSNPLEGLAEKRTRLDAMYTAEKADVSAELAKMLDFWGYSRIVP